MGVWYLVSKIRVAGGNNKDRHSLKILASNLDWIAGFLVSGWRFMGMWYLASKIRVA
jgi:hypothetical protein